MTYTVLVDDNFHYMDESERYTHGEFETLEAAIAACKAIVDDYLIAAHEPGMAPDELYSAYTMFGADPWISGGEQGVRFSAWDYAKQRCIEICAQDQNASEGKK